MNKLVARAEDGRIGLILVLWEENLRRLKAGEPIAFDIAEIVPEWGGSWCFIYWGPVHTIDVKEVHLFLEEKGAEHAFFLRMDEVGEAKIKTPEGFTVDITRCAARGTLPAHWHGDLWLTYAPTAHDAVERFAKYIGRDTTVINKGAPL